MKKYVSVFLLYIRGIFPGIGFIIGTFLAQSLMFWHQGLHQENLEWAFHSGFPNASVPACIGLLTFCCYHAFSDRGGKMGNTLLRLRISEHQGFWISVLANACMFTLYFLLQALVFIGFCFWYDPKETALEILVTAYGNPLFHQFLPLQDKVQTAANIAMILGLSICSAAYPMRQRHGRHSLTTFAMVILVVVYQFLQRESDHLESGQAIILFFGTAICIVSSLLGVLNLEVDDND